MGRDAVTDASVFVISPSGISPAVRVKGDRYRYRSHVYDATVLAHSASERTPILLHESWHHAGELASAAKLQTSVTAKSLDSKGCHIQDLRGQ